MRRTCAECGADFEAAHPNTRRCSDECKRAMERRKKRAQRSPDAKAAPVRPLPVEPAVGQLEAATAVELRAADRVESAAGQAALALARRVDGGNGGRAETGSAMASLVREYRATLAEAVRGAQQEADPLDEVRARREHKRSSA